MVTIDVLNNNEHVINVEVAEEADEDVFNTSFVEHSLVNGFNLSKSMNDIYAENIPQVGVRPKSLVFDCNETFFSVSNSCATHKRTA